MSTDSGIRPIDAPGALIPIPAEFKDMTFFPVEHSILAAYDASDHYLGRHTIAVGDEDSVGWSGIDVKNAVDALPNAHHFVHAHNHPPQSCPNCGRIHLGDLELAESVSGEDVTAFLSTAYVIKWITAGRVQLTDSLVIGLDYAYSLRRFIERVPLARIADIVNRTIVNRA